MAKQLCIQATARSTGSRHEVYKLLADSSTWAAWTPFTKVTLVEPSPDGGEGVGSVKQTRFRAMTGRERIVALVPDRQLSYAYIKGVFTPSIRDYVATVELEDDGAGTVIHWRSTFYERFPGSGRLPRRTLETFLQRCADGLAAAAAMAQSVT
jgi:Polyketide cyclase / dehydrase and lipid transport